MRKVKKSVWSLLLACAMVLTMFPASVWAAEETEQTVDTGAFTAALQQSREAKEIKLTENTTWSNSFSVESGTSVVLDLNGYTLQVPRINVMAGASLTVKDSSAEGKETTYSGTGKITGSKSDSQLIVVWPDNEGGEGGSFTLESGTIQSTGSKDTIVNGGNLLITGGRILAGLTEKGTNAASAVYNSARKDTFGDEASAPVICSISGDAYLEADVYTICLFGKGMPTGKLEEVDYDAVQLNIDGGTITGRQAIATNASSGKYAGFTINMTGGRISDGGHDGTGMYLPAIGKTTISGGSVTASQAIRICAGELEITGGTVTSTAAPMVGDMIAGGSGGTNGAVVIGKASNGYVGDISVSISGDAVIQNTADVAEGEIRPTIVVSDKHMAENGSQNIKLPNDTPSQETYTYESLAISVKVDGAEIVGDVVKMSNISQTPGDTSTDGGNTSLEISNTEIQGDVINQTSSTGVSVSNSTVESVVNKNGGFITVFDTTIRKGVKNEDPSDGTITILGGKVPEDVTTEHGITVIPSVGNGKILSSNGQTYTKLAEALADVPANGTLYLGEGTFQLQVNVSIDKNVTLLGANAGIPADGERKPESEIVVYEAQNVSNKSARISVASGKNVVFDGVTISGSYGADVAAPMVKLNGTAQLTIVNSFVTDTGENCSSGCGLINTMGAAAGSKLTIADSEIQTVLGSKNDSVYYAIGGAGTCELDIHDNSFRLGSWLMFAMTASGSIRDNVFYGREGQSGCAVKSTILDGLAIEENIFDETLSGTRFVIGGRYALTGNEFESLGDDLALYLWENNDTHAVITGNTFNLEEGSYGICATDEEKDITGQIDDLTIRDNIFHGTGVYQFQNDGWVGPLNLSGNEFPDGIRILNKEDSPVKVTLPEGPSRDGYRFTGWEINGETYQPGDEVELTGSTGEIVATPLWKRAPTSNSNDSEPSKGRPLPLRGETSPAFESDTTYDLTVNDVYQFRITSLDGHAPAMTLGNGNFRVELASRSGNDYFFKVYVQGNAGSTCGVFVDSQYLLTLTVGGSAVISDTTAPFTVARGGTYQFKLTAAQQPAFVAGSPCFTVEYAGNSGNDWFYKVHAVGEAGESSGFYINGSASPVAVASIG